MPEAWAEQGAPQGEEVASAMRVSRNWGAKLLTKIRLCRRCTYTVKNIYFHLKSEVGQRRVFRYDLSNSVLGCRICNEILKRKD